jgi:hypothetical protein
VKRTFIARAKHAEQIATAQTPTDAETLDTPQSQLCHMTYPLEAVFEGVDSGRRLSKRQLGFAAWKGRVTVERVENGFLVDGERYRHISE